MEPKHDHRGRQETTRYLVRPGAHLLAVLLAGLWLTGYNVHAQGQMLHRILLPRPIPLGVSGGTIEDQSPRFCCGGTLGALVQDTNGVRYVLSNNHVLSRSNFSQPGTAILQPSLLDTDCFIADSNIVAHLSAFAPLHYRLKGQKWSEVTTNLVDAALAEVLPGSINETGSILRIGPVSTTPLEPRPGMAVKKSGRTTGLTRGVIDAVDVTVVVRFGPDCGRKGKRKAIFTNQIRIRPATFSAGGDSGSLIVEDVDDCPRPVGLLFAGGKSDTIANRIRDVLEAFGVSLVGCDPPPLAEQPALAAAERDPLATARRIKRTHEAGWYELPDVVGSGLSIEPIGSGQPVIQVYVLRDTPGLRRSLPTSLDGIPVRVVQTGRYRSRDGH